MRMLRILAKILRTYQGQNNGQDLVRDRDLDLVVMSPYIEIILSTNIKDFDM